MKVYRNLFMARNRDVSDLLERFMEESGETQRWVTVSEVRTYFGLDELSAPAISGFLQRIYFGPFFSCPYRVERIEKVAIQKPQRRIIRRYLVTRRPPARQKNTADTSTRLTNTHIHDIFTDSAAIEHFDRVIRKSRDENDDLHGH
jgi:hypothetical protein